MKLYQGWSWAFARSGRRREGGCARARMMRACVRLVEVGFVVDVWFCGGRLVLWWTFGLVVE
eukprot:3671199-Pleurochrysis_carterae.AAC.1